MGRLSPQLQPRGVIRPARRPEGWTAPGPAPAGARGRPELEPHAGEDLCYLVGDWRVFQKQRGHRWSLDDLVTAWVAAREAQALPPGARALDLGCGLGSVLLMLAWKAPGLQLTGVEAQPDRAAMARRSIAWNGVEARCAVVDGDLRAGALPAEPRFELVTGTPPYFPEGTGTQSGKPHAAPCRFEHRGGVEAYLTAAAARLTPAGRFVICSAALTRERVGDAARALGLQHLARLTVVPREGKPALVLVDTFSRQASADAGASASAARAQRAVQPEGADQHQLAGRSVEEQPSRTMRGSSAPSTPLGVSGPGAPRSDQPCELVQGPAGPSCPSTGPGRAAPAPGATPPPTAVATLVVRDARGQWTPAFRALRDEMGMPPTPPQQRRAR